MITAFIGAAVGFIISILEIKADIQKRKIEEERERRELEEQERRESLGKWK